MGTDSSSPSNRLDQPQAIDNSVPTGTGLVHQPPLSFTGGGCPPSLGSELRPSDGGPSAVTPSFGWQAHEGCPPKLRSSDEGAQRKIQVGTLLRRRARQPAGKHCLYQIGGDFDSVLCARSNPSSLRFREPQNRVCRRPEPSAGDLVGGNGAFLFSVREPAR
jgi:hypothetical protein